MNIEVYVQKPAKVGTYSGRFGGKSTQVADAVVELSDYGVSLACVIWARLNRDRDTGEESITIEPGFPSGVTVENDEQRNAIKDMVLASAEVWVGFSAAQDAAVKRLLAKSTLGATTASRKVLTNAEIAAIVGPQPTGTDGNHGQ